MRPLSFMLLLALFVVPPSSGAQAPAPAEAVAVVETFNATLISVMRQAGELGYAGRYRWLAPAIRDSHDFAAITRVAAGRFWSALDQKQKALLQQVFTELSIATYAHRFDGYAGEVFDTVETRQLSNDRALVRVMLREAGGQNTQFDYLLRKESGDWRIVNVIADGVSDLALKRAEFARIMKSRGFDALIAKLRDKIHRYETSPGP